MKTIWILTFILFFTLTGLAAYTHPFWEDEAETALFAQSIVKTGLPKGFDGVNIFGFEGGIYLDNNLIDHVRTWPQFYLPALSFRLFGVSPFTARLPSLTVSILSLYCIFKLLILSTKNRKLTTISLILITTSVAYLLFCYQSRYYPLTLLGGFLSIYGLIIRQNTRHSHIAFTIGAILFIYNNYLIFPIFYTALLVSYSIYLFIKKTDGKDIQKELKSIIIQIGISIVLFLPWFLLLQPFGGSKDFAIPSLYEIFVTPIEYFHRLLYFSLNTSNIMPITLIPLVFLIFIVKIRQKEEYSLYAFFITFVFTTLLFISLLSPFFNNPRHDLTDIRYYVFLFPMCLIILSFMFEKIIRMNKIIGIIGIGLFISTNIFTLNKPQSFLFGFLNEIKNPYISPDMAVSEYLKTHAKENDTAFISLDRNHEPLIYLLGQKIRFVNRIHPANETLINNSVAPLPLYLYLFKDKPDWIILYSKRGKDGTFFTSDFRNIFPKGLYPGINIEKDYEETILPVYFTNTYHPEIELHSFYEIKPSYKDQIFIYRKKVQ